MFDYVRLDYMGVENGLQALFFKVSHKWNRLLILVLSLCFTVSLTEQDNFLISDWKLFYALGDNAIAEQTIFIYEDNTF